MTFFYVWLRYRVDDTKIAQLCDRSTSVSSTRLKLSTTSLRWITTLNIPFESPCSQTQRHLPFGSNLASMRCRPDGLGLERDVGRVGAGCVGQEQTSDPTQCLPERHVLHAMEVRGREACVREVRPFRIHILKSPFCGGLRLLVYTLDLVNVLPGKWNANHGWPYVRGPNSCSHAGYSEQLTNSTSECSRTRWATSRAFDVNLTTCDTSHPLAIPILFLFIDSTH